MKRHWIDELLDECDLGKNLERQEEAVRLCPPHRPDGVRVARWHTPSDASPRFSNPEADLMPNVAHDNSAGTTSNGKR